MKLIKQASGKTTVKMSRKEWTDLGKKAGWMKEAAEGLGEDYTDDDEGPECPKCGEYMARGERVSGPDWECPNCEEGVDEDFDDPDDRGSYEQDAKEWGGMELPDSPY
jgi:hypothetical protein